MHIGDPKTCLEFLDYYPECLGRITALAMRANHSQDPKHWMELFKRLAHNAHNVRYLDMFWSAPTEPWSFPRCGPNPWSKDEKVLAVLGSIQVMASSRMRGDVMMGGLFPDSAARFLEQKMGGRIKVYLPSWYEHPTVFFSTPKDVERNSQIPELSSLFTFKIDISEPTSFSAFLDKLPGFGDRFDNLKISVYNGEKPGDWITLFQRLAREATRLDNVRVYWDHTSRSDERVGPNSLSRDWSVLEALASIKVKYSVEIAGDYSSSCVSFLERKMSMIGRQMLCGNHELKRKFF
jgi:hypothetical protein